MIKYLGNVIGQRSLENTLHTPDEEKQMKIPRKVTEVRYFLRPCNVSRRPVPNSTQIPEPPNRKILNRLTKII